MRLEFEPILTSNPYAESVQHEIAPDNTGADECLREGIKAAQAGNRAKARVSLLQASELDPRNETTWLWLASISEYPEELLVFLTNVLDTNPSNERALEWMDATKSLLAKTLVQRGIDAAETHQTEAAVQYFNQALEYDQRNSMAWLWMASMSDSNEGKMAHLEKVLAIDPENETANNAFKTARHEIHQSLLSEARSAAVSGKPAKANEMLDAILAQNPDSEDAWILRSYLADDFNQKVKAFERVLEINPDNRMAIAGLESLMAIMETATPNKQEPAEKAETAAESFEEMNVAETIAVDLNPTDELEFPEQFVADLREKNESTIHFEAAEPAKEQANFDPFSETTTFTLDSLEMNFAEMQQEATASVTDEAEEKAVPMPDFEPEEDVVEYDPMKTVLFAEPLEPIVPEADEKPVEMPAQDFEPEQSEIEFDPMRTVLFAEPLEPLVPETNENPFAADSEDKSHFNHLGLDSQLAENPPSLEEVIPKPFEVLSPTAEDVGIGSAPTQLIPETNGNGSHSPGPACPFCKAENDAQAVVCQSCMAMLTLSDLEMLLSNPHADKFTLRQAVEKMEVERGKRDFSESELTMLGIGHLNLRNLESGYSYLHEASQINPNNVVLSSQVNSLHIRLEEIKLKDGTQESMPKGKTILVVDDSPTVRKLIVGKLEKSGHEVFCSNDGVEAIERLQSLVPDLILLDITMPRMDGYQVCKLIRTNPATQDVPVLMISGKDGFFDKVRGRMAGATGYITKPFGPETLMKAVETYLVKCE